MNERIRELAEQAGIEFDDDLALEPETIYYTTQEDLEKFAELIVKETLLVARVGIEYGDSMEFAVYKYFGIEE